MTALTEFLFPAPAKRRAGAIWQWWEGRRLAYNAWVGGAGALTVAFGYLLTVLPPDGPGSFPPFHFILRPVLLFGVLANVCYTGGSLIEILAHKLFGRQLLPVGPALYRIGLTFSVGLALFPALLMFIAWIVRIVTAVL